MGWTWVVVAPPGWWAWWSWPWSGVVTVWAWADAIMATIAKAGSMVRVKDDMASSV